MQYSGEIGIQKACSSEAKIVQHCWPNDVARCMHSKVVPKLKPTLFNIIQQGVQTNMLHPTILEQHDGFVLTGLILSSYSRLAYYTEKLLTRSSLWNSAPCTRRHP
jgi:hypothetical protein